MTTIEGTSSVRPRRTRTYGKREIIELAVPLAIALVGTVGLFLLTPLDGAFGFVLIGMCIFLGVLRQRPAHPGCEAPASTAW